MLTYANKKLNRAVDVMAEYAVDDSEPWHYCGRFGINGPAIRVDKGDVDTVLAALKKRCRGVNFYSDSLGLDAVIYADAKSK
jgi:hypothetical protein